jgi:hypothetical protein
MNYTITAEIYREVVANRNTKNSTDAPVYVKELSAKKGFNVNAGSKDATFTANELKEKIKEKLNLFTGIKEVELRGKNGILADDSAVLDYGLSFSAVIEYKEIVKPVKAEEPVVEPVSETVEPVSEDESATEAPAEN